MVVLVEDKGLVLWVLDSSSIPRLRCWRTPNPAVIASSGRGEERENKSMR